MFMHEAILLTMCYCYTCANSKDACLYIAGVDSYHENRGGRGHSYSLNS